MYLGNYYNLKQKPKINLILMKILKKGYMANFCNEIVGKMKFGIH